MLIFHGENIIESRKAFLAERQKVIAAGNQVVELSGSELTLSQLQDHLSTTSMFGDTVIFIENFFSSRPSNNKKSLSQYLVSQLSSNLYFWDGKDVSLQLKSFSPQFIRKFDLPQYLFRFIDSLDLDLYWKSLSSAAPEQIFALLVSRFHQLIEYKSGVGSFSPWQLSKLKPQASKYSLQFLISSYLDLLHIDYSQKTSNSVSNLQDSLALWLVKL
jgi:hypothetical protein